MRVVLSETPAWLPSFRGGRVRSSSPAEGADLATTEVATTSPPEIATTRTYIHQI